MNEPVYKINGKAVPKEEFNKGNDSNWLKASPPMVSKTYQEHDPLISDSLGCLPNQVPEMREEIRKRGITGAKVRNNGQLEFTSRRGRNEVMKMRGKHDADGGFGDG